MIKALFTAFTGIDESIDSEENQASWEHQKYLDDHDLDSDVDQDDSDDDDYEDKKSWWALW